MNWAHFVAESGNNSRIHIDANDGEVMLADGGNEIFGWEILQITSIDYKGSLFDLGLQIVQPIARIVATLGVIL